MSSVNVITVAKWRH